MQALISALNPAIAILCAVNLLWHLRALNAKLRHSGDIVAVCLSLTGMALLWESFTTQWMVLVHLNAILLAWDALTLLLKPFRGARKAHETLRALSRRGLAFLLGALLGAYRGEALKDALWYGAVAAACSLGKPGATEGVRKMEEALNAFERV